MLEVKILLCRRMVNNMRFSLSLLAQREQVINKLVSVHEVDTTITAVKLVSVLNRRKCITVSSCELYSKLLHHSFITGKYYWKLTREGISSGSPRLISHIWPELPSDIDAATAFSRDRIYFFKGNKFWTCFYSHCTCAYISVGWPGIPDHVNGVTWAGGYIFYFFKGKLPTVKLSSSTSVPY